MTLSDIGSPENCQHHVLGSDPRRALSAHLDAYRLRHRGIHILGDPGVEDGGGTDTEGDTTNGSRMRRVRVASDDQLARQSVVLQNFRVTDRLGSTAIGLSMQGDPVVTGKFLLLRLQLLRGLKQTHLASLRRDRLLQKSQMVAKEDDRIGIGQRFAFSDLFLEQVGSHRSDIFMTESKVAQEKSCISHPGTFTADLSC